MLRKLFRSLFPRRLSKNARIYDAWLRYAYGEGKVMLYFNADDYQAHKDAFFAALEGGL